MDVSIIIVNYNTRQLTLESVNSVFEKTKGIDFEVILVDNGSTDGSIELFWKDPRITFIESGTNIGFGRANNLGIKIAKGRNILFLNPDTLLINNVVKILSDYLDANDKVGSCGGNVFNENLQPVTSFFRFFPGYEEEFNNLTGNRYGRMRFGKNYYHNFTDSPIKIAFVSGADMMVKKTVLDKVGYFESDFFLFYEETELAYRIKKAGYENYSVPQAQLVHYLSKSFKINEEKTRLYYLSRQIIYNKIYSKIKIRILNAMFIVHHKSRAFLAKLLGQKKIYESNKVMLRVFREACDKYYNN